MLALMGLIRKLARPLALWRQQLGADLSWGWGDVVRHLQGFPPRSRYFFWTVCVALLSLHLTHLMAKGDDADVVWGPPVEPPGSIVVTSMRTDLNSDGMQLQNSANAGAVVQFGATGPADSKAEAADGQLWPPGLHASLQQWSQAWRRQDVPAYLGMYDADFVPSRGVSRQAWAESRARRIMEKSSIRHDMQDLNVQMNASTAIVKFTQIYQDERVKLIDQKTMHWVQRDGLWMIALEKVH